MLYLLRTIILLYLITSTAYANDGAFYAKGNQLIPITETDIMIKKEILTIKKKNDRFIDVSVYYEFYNPKNEKEIEVGFEAFSPSGDVDGTPKNGQHPYMRDFTVEANNTIFNYQVSYVSDTAYNHNGIIKSIDLKKIREGSTSGNYVDFFYVYHFSFKFKKGLNVIKHTYKYDLSGSVDLHYDFEYVLTAANRWGNKQIDDFTLILDMGEFESFYMDKSFFKNKAEWILNGIGKSHDIQGNDSNSLIEMDALKFHIQNGTIIFQKANFKPVGDLFVYATNYWGFTIAEYVPFSYYQEKNINEPENEFERKILKNLPFARRGYVFHDQELQHYFAKLDWYIPNANYLPDVETLTEGEKKWVEKWK